MNKITKNLFKILQGALIGLGAVLPGISGGVLCVVFGFYTTIMEFLADPIRSYRTHLPKLLPVFIGAVIGFMGVANMLSFFLERYPNQSVCVFVGLIGGMLPALMREAGEQGTGRASYISMLVSMTIVFTLLVCLKLFSVSIQPAFWWHFFCGVCLALSVIVPGLSFSTLLMPLGLYETFVAGIGHMNFGVLIPAGLGALATLAILSRAVNALFASCYSVAYHAIVGIVMAATVMIIPFQAFAQSVSAFIANTLCIAAGITVGVCLDKFNEKNLKKIETF
ncbi:MAG: DUF368 domain-containing protein [Lachnospiraceae bacterium]